MYLDSKHARELPLPPLPAIEEGRPPSEQAAVACPAPLPPPLPPATATLLLPLQPSLHQHEPQAEESHAAPLPPPLPPPPPATAEAFSKKSEESNGVIAMIDMLIKDLEKEMTQAELEEKDGQEDRKSVV